MSTTTATPTRARRSMASVQTPIAEPVPSQAAVSTADASETLPPAQGSRRPFGARRQRLENPPIPGFQCYWFNDIPGRIDQAKEAGYEHVTDSGGKPVMKVVGVMEGGGGLKAYRMKIPIEFYEQDQAAKEAPRTELDAQMRQGNARDSGYASQGRPGYVANPSGSEAPYSQATMNSEGRQRFGASKPQ